MPQLTDDVTYPPVAPILPEDRFVIATAEGVRKLLYSSLLEQLAAESVGEGIDIGEPNLITMEATDEQPVDSWFGDSSLWKFYEFTVPTSSNWSVMLPGPFVVSGAEDNLGAEAYVFEGSLVDGTIPSSGSDLLYTEHYFDDPTNPDTGVVGVASIQLPAGDYVLAIGVWSSLDAGTVLDITGLLLGLSLVTEDLPNPTGTVAAGVPFYIDPEGAVHPSYDLMDWYNQLGPHAGAFGTGNVIANDNGLAVGYANHCENSGSVAIGFGNRASNTYSLVVGTSTRGRWQASINVGSNGSATRVTNQRGAGNARMNFQLLAPSGTVAHYDIRVVARSADYSLVKAWSIDMTVSVPDSSTRRVVGTPTVTVLAEDTGASSWGLSVGYDFNGPNVTPSGLPSDAITSSTLIVTELAAIFP